MERTLDYEAVGDLLVRQDVEESRTVTESIVTAISLVSTVPDEPVLDDVVDTDALDRLFSEGRDGGTLLLELWGLTVVVTPDEIRVYDPTSRSRN